MKRLLMVLLVQGLLPAAPLTWAANTTLGTNAGAALNSTYALENLLVGSNAGKLISYGDYCTYVGAEVGVNMIDASGVIVGYQAASQGSSVERPTIMGTRAGYKVDGATYISLLGYEAGYNITDQKGAVFIGSGAGYSYNSTSSDAEKNVYVGYGTGYHLAEIGNTALGSLALYGREPGVSAAKNTALGYRAGYGIGSGSNNVALGDSAGYDLDTGNYNTLIGARAGERLQDQGPQASTLVGSLAGANSQGAATGNSFLGAGAGSANQTGSYNLVVGAFADFADWSSLGSAEVEAVFSAEAHTSTGLTALDTEVSSGVLVGAYGQLAGDSAVVVGYGAKATADYAIALGSGASATHLHSIALGYGSSSHGDYIAVLGNSSTLAWQPQADGVTALGSSSYSFSNLYSQALAVQADADSGLALTLAADAGADAGDSWQLAVADGGDLSLSNNLGGSQTLKINLSSGGDLTVTGNVDVLSDSRVKKNLAPIPHALMLVKQLQPKRYYWRAEAGRDQHLHFGLIAQELAELLPELIKTRADGYLSVNYPALLPLLAQAGGELAAHQDQQQRQLDSLSARLDALEAALAARGGEAR